MISLEFDSICQHAFSINWTLSTCSSKFFGYIESQCIVICCEMYVEHQFCDWHAELCCTYHHQWAEMGSSITHSGWAALAAYKATALTTQFYCMFTKHWMAWPLPIWLTSLHHISRERTIESLRSASKHYLDTPCTSSKTYGDRAFMSAAPRQWDELPEDIQSSKSLEVFKTNLKTHLNLQGFYRWTHMSPAGGFLVLISASFVLCCFMLVWLLKFLPSALSSLECLCYISLDLSSSSLLNYVLSQVRESVLEKYQMRG